MSFAKLMIAGEWAVLAGGRCVVAALDETTDVQILEGQNTVAALGRTVSFAEAEKELPFVAAAIDVVEKYLGTLRQCHLIITSRIGKGLGSSAAVVSAVVEALLAYNGKEADKLTVYKLAMLAHYRVQGLGSGFDIAAATYGGILVYRMPEPAWLASHAQDVTSCVLQQWPGLEIEALSELPDMRLLMGWTGSGASTVELAMQMETWKQENAQHHKDIMDAISATVERLIAAWKEQDTLGVVAMLQQNEQLLEKLTQDSGVPIVTEKLRLLAALADTPQSAGKTSGAGGEFAIALCFDEELAQSILAKWRGAGMEGKNAGIGRRV